MNFEKVLSPISMSTTKVQALIRVLDLYPHPTRTPIITIMIT
jgi:hypothetical protein